jgi:hypothetical protein
MANANATARQSRRVVGQFESVLKGRGFRRAVNASKSVAALEVAENSDFGWRSAFSTPITVPLSMRALASGVSFSGARRLLPQPL